MASGALSEPCAWWPLQSPLVVPPPGVSKIVTVDVKGNSPLWLKVKDLAEGVTYRFRIRAKTFTYGPEIEANVTTGPGEGRRAMGQARPPHSSSAPSVRRGPQCQELCWTLETEWRTELTLSPGAQ